MLLNYIQKFDDIFSISRCIMTKNIEIQAHTQNTYKHNKIFKKSTNIFLRKKKKNENNKSSTMITRL